jgi:hypothetical protein
MSAEYIGIAYTDPKNRTTFQKVNLGKFAPNPSGGWSRANTKALNKLERIFPDAWMFDVRQVGWKDYSGE